MKSIPTAEALYDVMCKQYEQATGFHPEQASDIGIRMRVLSTQLSRLGAELEQIAADAFPQTATEKALELHAQARGLLRKPAQAATGVLRFRRTAVGNTVTIPIGTICSNRSGGLRFEILKEGSIPADGLEVDIPARALAVGEVGNVAGGMVCMVLSAVTGISGVTNPHAFSGGSSAETDDALRQRLLSDLSNPPDSANRAYYLKTAGEVSGVRAVHLLPRVRGGGTLDAVIATHNGYDAASVAAQLEALYGQEREIGTDILVRPADALATEIAAMVSTEEGYSPDEVASACEESLTRYLGNLYIGQPLLLSRLSGCFLEVEGVENFRIVSPKQDVIPADDEIVSLGELSIGKVASL